MMAIIHYIETLEIIIELCRIRGVPSQGEKADLSGIKKKMDYIFKLSRITDKDARIEFIFQHLKAIY